MKKRFLLAAGGLLLTGSSAQADFLNNALGGAVGALMNGAVRQQQQPAPQPAPPPAYYYQTQPPPVRPAPVAHQAPVQRHVTPPAVQNTAAPVHPTPAAAAPASSESGAPPSVDKLTVNVTEIRGLIVLYNTMIDEQKAVAEAPPTECNGSGNQSVATQAIAAVKAKISFLQADFRDKTTILSRYSTSIKPNDPDQQITARKASELFPKVPYYIPGTPDTGEFWLEPFVNDSGDLVFNLKFVDPRSDDRVRGMIPLSVDEVERTRDALCRVTKWSATAHEHGLRREFTKRAECFPASSCPVENEKRDHATSTEIDFKVYEDGSTAGRIQRNKGLFEEGYNISIDSALLLETYLNHVLVAGKKEYNAGTASQQQINELFK